MWANTLSTQVIYLMGTDSVLFEGLDEIYSLIQCLVSSEKFSPSSSWARWCVTINYPKT